MKIQLSRADFNKIFAFLDKQQQGFLTFNTFCGIVDGADQRELEPSKFQEIQEAIADKIRSEKIQEAKDKEQKKLEAMSVASSHY
jgi:hypothetical protein